ncbi:MAG TPA: DUF6252 family protein [Cytophagaceae bacterium]|jgi:hypothetical protein
MKNFFVACLLAAVLFNCNKKKDEPSPSTGAPTTNSSECGTLTVKKGLVSHTVTSFNNSLLFDRSQEGRRLDIRGTVDGGTFVITVSNYDFQNPPENGIKLKTYFEDYTQSECKDDGEISYCDGMLGTFLKDNKTYMTFADEGDGFVVISSMDTNNKKVSGSFKFTAMTIDRTDTIPFSGTFSNLCYSLK